MLDKLISAESENMLVRPVTLCFTERFSNAMLKFNNLSGALERLTHRSLDLKQHKTVQIFDDLYAFSQRPLVAFKLSNATSLTENEMAPAKEPLAASGHNRERFAIANGDNKAIYITGGRIDGVHTNTALIFDLESETFAQVAARMNEARY